jgi:hypothetical protein
LPDYAVIICDDREYLRAMVEGLLYGTYMYNSDKWRFYKAYEFDLPTMAEIKNLKALILWASTSSPSFKELSDPTQLSWIKPVIKVIKKAYNECPNLKILGMSLGQYLIATALGGKVERRNLDEAQKIARNINRGLFCGKDVIKLNDSFFKLDCVKKVLGENKI